MSDDTGNGGVLGFEARAGVAGGVDQRGLYTVDPVTGERCYGDGWRIFTDDGARAKIPSLDATYLAVAEQRLATMEAAFERYLPLPLLRPSEPKPIADTPMKLAVGGVVLAFRPQRDMSAYELAMIWKLWMLATSGQAATGVIDWLAANDLLRHFEVV